MKLSAKILFSIQSTAVLIFIISIGYVSLNSKYTTEKDAKRLTDAYAREYANIVKSELNVDITVSRSMAHMFMSENMEDMNLDLYDEMLKSIFLYNPMFRAVWASLELQFKDSIYKKKYGRIRSEVFKIGNRIVVKRDSLNLDGDDKASTYYNVKVNPGERITDPYDYSSTGSSQDAILVTSVLTPLIVDNEFAGMLGLDVPLARFQKITDKIKPFKDSYAFLIANNGTMVAHPKESAVGKLFSNVFPLYSDEHKVMEKIKRSEFLSFTMTDEKDEEKYVSFAPFKIGNTKTPWAIGIVVPMKKISETANQSFTVSLIVSFLGLLVLSLVIWLISRYITNPLNKTVKILNDLAKGIIDKRKKLNINTKDEIGDIANSINLLISGLVKTATFANEIGKGNLDVKHKMASKNDVLGKALLEMRDSLRKSKKQDLKRKKQDNKNVWNSDGLAKFGEILRNSNDDLQELGFSFIKNLVEYLKANQGGIFIINNNNKDDIFVELIASYAYNRRKFLTKRIEMGVGLIGTCILEKEIIHLNNVPKNYLEIESGLGNAKPKSLILSPMIFNEKVYGVIEISSFKKLKSYQIDFIKRVSERVCSTISSLQVNINTKKLLVETQRQSEILLSQEEEMRQNLEEIQATQEEAHRKSSEMQEYLDTVNSIFSTMETDMEGIITNINYILLDALGYNFSEIKGKSIKYIFSKKFDIEINFDSFLDNLNSGIKQAGLFTLKTKYGKSLFLKANFIAVKNEEGYLYKILLFGMTKEQEKNLENQ